MNIYLFFRYTIYSPKDGQPCMDHDRQTGEVIFLVDIFMCCLWFLNTEWKKCILVKCILYILNYLFSVVSTCENWMNSTFENTYPELWIVFSTVAIFCDCLAICATNITTAYHYLFVETKQISFCYVAEIVAVMSKFSDRGIKQNPSLQTAFY